VSKFIRQKTKARRKIKNIIMYKLLRALIPLAVVMFFLQGKAEAQVVYITKYKSEADKVIYVSRYKSDANLVVYDTKYKSEAMPMSGIWYYTKYKSEADWVIYFTDYKSEADIVVYYTKYKSEAGWNN